MNGIGLALIAAAFFLFLYGCGTTADYSRDCDLSLDGKCIYFSSKSHRPEEVGPGSPLR